ncbi:MAG: M81 family metallopeptidase [Planctomycetota bacterium]
MRIGIIGLLHESNTFVTRPTTLENFRDAVLLTGDAIRPAFDGAHHEIGGFLAGIDAAGETAIPIFVARALPAGTITADAFDELTRQLLAALKQAGPLDGLLVAPHGATVSANWPDADGHWLSLVREQVGDSIPIVGTIDAHANLSPLMVNSVDALIAYRSNPHLDQRERGLEAAALLVRTLLGEVRPTMAAAFPPLAISIEQQETAASHLVPHYDFADSQLELPEVLSNSIVLGFPYADVPEMGSSTIAVTNNDASLAQQLADELAERLWQHREDFRGELLNAEQALDHCEEVRKPICLLDMGDNVGGGSAADGTFLLNELLNRSQWRSFVCLFDPSAVDVAQQTGIGNVAKLSLGGHVDDLHGEPIVRECRIVSLNDGQFRETRPRHGGMSEFDQGPTAVVETGTVTVMLTSRRMVPFSLEQLRSCDLDPATFDILVAKGVNAPLAAYREVCPTSIRVNTLGSTCADMTQLSFRHRRQPMYPFQPEVQPE